MWKLTPDNAPQPDYRTWLSVWMDMKRLSVPEFARIVMIHPSTAKNWRRGSSMRPHYSKCVKAWFPDAPIDARGGCPVSINQELPCCSRSREMYKFIHKVRDLLAGADPAVLARAAEVSF